MRARRGRIFRIKLVGVEFDFAAAILARAGDETRCCLGVWLIHVFTFKQSNYSNANCPNRPSQNEYRKRVPIRLHLISVIAKLRAPSRRDKSVIGFTTSLIPAFSPRRRRIIRRRLENSRDWICQTAIHKTRNVRQLFPLLGERIKGEGGRKHKSQLPQSSIPK
jgi:hypothetical protein